MKRPLFVFAGQSNMMGAAVYPASEQIYFENSFEYLHKPRRFGEKSGEFKNYGFPCGEFCYKDLEKAYGNTTDFNTKSPLSDYGANTFFCPSMCNLENDQEKTTNPFKYYSESNALCGTSLPPFIVKGLEENGYPCAYTHITKGGSKIAHFVEGRAAEYFDQKVNDFFTDCQQKFPNDDLSEKILVWLQGESNTQIGYENYKESLKIFWERLKKNGFTKFFMIRVGYWGKDEITNIMRAQEEFCEETANAYMITRVCSFFEFKGQQNTENWFKKPITEEFTFCRDSFYGFDNQHINEKGFKIIAKYALPNIIRILFETKEPILEEENIIPLI
ncbi:MAG: hypothetical protein IKT32_02750 [Clostridia bacterium]|nr:hypothetical protein [Clostridia bacterium]